jgi:hypothetical protein
MKKILKLLAILVWYIGVVALSIKSYKLFFQAYSINSNITYLALVLLIGVLLSLLKTKYIFIKSCKKNLQRIDSLKNPKIWNFYRFRFILFLIAVILLGTWLSHLASGNYIFLLIVGVVDMALALALLFSSYIFFI